MSSDQHDLKALTPNIILLLRRHPSFCPVVFDESDKFKARWKHVHLLANEFWCRWTKECLPTLQERQKYLCPKPNFRVGDLVLMVDRNMPLVQWPIPWIAIALKLKIFPSRLSEGGGVEEHVWFVAFTYRLWRLSFVVIILYKNTRNLTHRSCCLSSILASVAGPYTPTPVSYGRKLLNRGGGGGKGGVK